MSDATHHGSVDVVRKTAIVASLLGGVVLMHRFAGDVQDGFDPRGLLSLGFVVLAAYAIGELSAVLRLPHITGYLLAGLAFGPSVAHELGQAVPGGVLPRPFDEGILSEGVIAQLGLLDQLALPLICLAAGGHIELRQLRKGIRPVLGVAFGQVAALLLAFSAFAWVISGGIPALTMPALANLPTTAVLPIGGLLAAMGLATSAAATIAILLETRAQGPLARAVLSVVVVKDVLVVVMFAAFLSLTAVQLGTGGTSFVQSLQHLAISIVVGVVLAGLVHAYLRFVDAERLLFLVGIIFTTVFACEVLHAEVALVFITAGLLLANFSSQGEPLLREVERLSLPVFVVFFTLAGARLHLDALVSVAGFAVALVALRAAAIWVGVQVGGSLTGADPATRTYGWMGMISQAGLTLSLAGELPGALPGGVGDGLYALILAGVAVHEVVGPALLQTGLQLAGETADKAEPPTAETGSVPIPNVPPGQHLGPDPWAAPVQSESAELIAAVLELQADLEEVAHKWVTANPRVTLTEDEAWLGSLRREFLRAQRRATALVRERAATPEALHATFQEVSGVWKELVLRRAARPRSGLWNGLELLQGVERRVDGVPAAVEARVEPSSLVPRPEGWWKAWRRRWLKARDRFRPITRVVPLEDLARFHLSGTAAANLEGVLAVGVRGELELADRVATAHATLTRGWSAITAAVAERALEPEDLEARLWTVRREVEEELQLAVETAQEIGREAERRVRGVLGHALGAMKDDVGTAGTLDLPYRQRRFGRIYERRNRGLAALTAGAEAARSTLGARYSALALEIEVAGLEIAIAEEVTRFGGSLQRLTEDLGVRQLRKAQAAVEQLVESYRQALASGDDVEATVARIRSSTDVAMKQLSDTRRLLGRLRDQLSGEHVIAPLRDALLAAGQSLTDWYTVPARKIEWAEWAMPAPVPRTDVHLREMALAFIETTIAGDLFDEVHREAVHAEQGVAAVEELERVVSFNADLAMGELEGHRGGPVGDDVRDLAREMLLGAVTRSMGSLTRALEALCERPTTLRARVNDLVLGELRTLRAVATAGDATDLRRILLREAALGRQMVRRVSRAAPASTVGTLRRVVRETLGPDRIAALRGWLGLKPAERTSTPVRETFEAPRPRIELPLVYRRLFSDQGLGTGDLIVGRRAEIERACAVLGRRDGLRVVALVGPPGSGKGAISSAIWRMVDRGEPHRLDATAPITPAEVDRWFETSGDLVHFAGLRWLFRLEPGGTESLNRFVSRLLQEGGQRAWLLSVDSGIWHTACRLAPLRELVAEVIEVGPLSPEELEQAVLSRHRMSAYSLTFAARRPTLASFERLLGPRVDAAWRRAWFRDLHAASSGVVVDGLRLWLASIDELDDKAGRMRVGPVRSPPRDAIAALPVDDLLVLRHTLRQGWICADLHAAAFRVDPAHSRAVLAGLVARGMLEGEPERLRLARHLRTPLADALEARGWAA